MSNIPVLIDAIDERILTALQNDSELSSAALSEFVGASAASCWRRIKALEAAGVLRKAVRLVDPALVGRDVNVMCQVRLRGHTDEYRLSFEDFVTRRPEIMECYRMSGDWDYMLRIVVSDVTVYDALLMDGVLSHPAVQTASSHFALKRVKYTTVLPIGV